MGPSGGHLAASHREGCAQQTEPGMPSRDVLVLPRFGPLTHSLAGLPWVNGVIISKNLIWLDFEEILKKRMDKSVFP